MTAKDVRNALAGVADSVTLRNGVWTARRGFFYAHGGSAEAFAAAVRRALPTATVLDSWEKWTPFRGGDSVARGSHWGVKFTVPATDAGTSTEGLS